MTEREALKLARTALGVQLDALLGKAGHLRNDERRRYAENGIKAIDEALAQRTEQEQQIETLKRCLFQMQEAAKDLVKQAKSLPPPQRTWVGLTDEEMQDLWDRYAHMEMMRAIEAKLKEKNNG